MSAVPPSPVSPGRDQLQRYMKSSMTKAIQKTHREKKGREGWNTQDDFDSHEQASDRTLIANCIAPNMLTKSMRGRLKVFCTLLCLSFPYSNKNFLYRATRMCSWVIQLHSSSFDDYALHLPIFSSFLQLYVRVSFRSSAGWVKSNLRVVGIVSGTPTENAVFYSSSVF